MVPDSGQSLPTVGPDVAPELHPHEALRDNRRWLATLLDNLPGMAYRCRNDRGWTMEFVSEGSRALTGYAPAELTGREGIVFGDLILEEEREEVWRQVQAALQARTPFQITYRLRRRDGTVAWLWERGQGIFTPGEPDVIEGFITDITAQRNAEEALRASEEKFEKAFVASPDAISVHEMLSGRFVDVNPGMLRLFGYTRDELIGSAPTDLGIWVDETERRDFLEALRRDGTVRERKVRVRLKDGRIRLCELSAEAMAIGGRAHNVTVLRDVTERRQTEQTLRESEEKFATAFRSSPRPLAISEAATGRYIEVNDGFEKLMGFTRAEVVGRTSAELGVWESAAARDEWVARLQRDGSVRDLELTFRGRQGNALIMRCSSENIEIGGIPCILSSLEDITEQRRTEQALRESEERVASAFRASPDSMAIVDAETNQYLEINEGFEWLFGFTRAEVIGRSPHDLKILANPEDAARLRGLLTTEGRVRDAQVEVLTKDGQRRTVLHSIEPILVAGRKCFLRVSHDITESKAAEQAMRDSETKFSTAFRASPMALTIVELATGRFIEVNHAFERISGYTRAEAIGRTTLELALWSAADRAVHVERLRRDGFVRGVVLTFRTRSGQEVHMRSNADVITVDGVQCILTVLEDVSEQRRLELQQATLEAQLRQNQKIEALGTLAGGIAHDFNNILTAIVVNQELALMDIHDSAAVTQRLGEIGQASSRAKELVRQILTFSRQQQHERLRQQLQMTVHEALSLVRASLPATIEIIQELSPEAPAVLADAGQVHQVVMNLCTNAAYAMRDKPGCLAVHLTARHLDEKACRDRPPLQPGLHAMLSVTDTGCGMEPAVLARIFEPFFTTKGPGEGTGLGLPMVHGIMRDHDGGIFVTSQPGVGTTFELFFPAAPESAPEAPIFDEPILRGHGESILVIDDESAICAAVGAMLGKLGYRVETFCDAEEGLARFRAAPAAFDLVLTDRTMPRLTGPELLGVVQQLRPGLPALLMSGLNGPGDATATGYGLVPKPLDISLLSRVVRHALDAARPA
jgi:PAS domain S-box-containing protein